MWIIAAPGSTKMNKSKYMEAEEFVKHFGNWYTEEGAENGFIGTIKECEYCSNSDEYLNGRWCKVLLVMVQNSDYCSYWEKKDG